MWFGKKIGCYFLIQLIILSGVFYSSKNGNKINPNDSTANKNIEKVSYKDSATSKNLNKILAMVKEKMVICDDCSYKYDSNQLQFLFTVFNDDLATKNFSDLVLNDMVSFSLCNDKRELVYIDCFYLFELKVGKDKEINKIFNSFNKISNTTIHYKPPQNWTWYKMDGMIYFLYSRYYELGSKEFNSIDLVIGN